MGLNNPIPRSLKSESKKAAKILSSFIKPNQALGPDAVIPHQVLLDAKGLAIITVIKAGFLFSGRAGSGVVVARLPDGSWSAPSAIATAGAGVGGQIGAEVTDFVFILNTDAAVESFAQFGSVTLGGNVSVAAGPLGRNAEVAGSASLKNVAAVFAYSKTKGLFAGVSVEGSVLVERREANRKYYGDNCKARWILSGQVAPPPSAEPLMRVLNSKAFCRSPHSGDDDYYSDDDDYLDDVPSNFSDDTEDTDDYRDDPSGSRAYYSRNKSSASNRARSGTARSHASGASWEDDVYDRYGSPQRSTNSGYRPRSAKPDFRPPSQRSAEKSSSGPANSTANAASSGVLKNKAIALYSFAGQQDGDLPFKKGDVITIIQKSDSTDDWWTGRIGSKQGIFPANYVELV